MSSPAAGPFDVAAGIAAAVDRMTQSEPRLGPTRVVAVDGPSGSGKTSLAGPLADACAAAIGGRVVVPARIPGEPDGGGGSAGASGATGAQPAPEPPLPAGQSQRADRGRSVAVVSTDLLATWEQPLDWWPILEDHLLRPLAAGRPARMPVVAWVSGNPRPGGSIEVPRLDVLILEGVSSGRRAMADRLGVLVWVEEPDPAARLERAVGRDGEQMRRFLRRWQVDEQAHFVADGTRERADIVIHP